jgi:hypothetical protein
MGESLGFLSHEPGALANSTPRRAWPALIQPILRLRLLVRHFREYRLEPLPAAARGALLSRVSSAEVFSATAMVMSWLIDTPSRLANSRTFW